MAVAVGVSDRGHVTGDMRHVKHDTWHVIPDTWHVTCDTFLSVSVYFRTRREIQCLLYAGFFLLHSILGNHMFLFLTKWFMAIHASFKNGASLGPSVLSGINSNLELICIRFFVVALSQLKFFWALFDICQKDRKEEENITEITLKKGNPIVLPAFLLKN